MNEDLSNHPKNGPEQILPSNVVKTHDPSAPVILSVEDYGIASLKPKSVHGLITDAVSNFPNHPALAIKRDGEWKYWSFKEYYAEIRRAAKAFIKLGLERFHGVCIMGAGSPEWVIAHYGCILAGGLSVGVYTTNSAESCRHIADQSKAQVVLVQDEVMLQKFLAIKHALPHLKVIVQWLGVPGAPGVLSWPEFLAIGGVERDKELNQRLALSAINQCCTLIYTSGTTGPPKGVMLSQDNLTWSGRYKYTKYPKCVHAWLCYLPPNHIASLLVFYVSFYLGATTYFADPDALQGSLLQTMIEVQPTGFFGVPRVWEKMADGLKMVLSQTTGITARLVNWARYQSSNYWEAQLSGRELSKLEVLKYNAAERYVLQKIREKLGLGRAQGRVGTGSAPTDESLFDFFVSFGLCLTNTYGMSESSAICSYTAIEPGMHRTGSTGQIAVGVHAKLIPGDFQRPGEGEICMKGRHVCMGYLSLPEETNNAIDDSGWLHSGDIGSFDKDGFLFITGRIKELVITAGGENIPPVRIEEVIKSYLPFISNAMVVGDRRKYLSLLLTLKTDMDLSTGMPLTSLTKNCVSQLQSLDLAAETVEDVLKDINQNPESKFVFHINEALKRYNEENAESHAQRLQKWKILPHDFSLPTEELNNTLKLKRSFVLQKYSNLIDEMYTENNSITSKL